MKTKEHEIIFNKEDVQQLVQLIGDRNPIYQSSERAKNYGFETIPLPPTMPMMAYKWLAPHGSCNILLFIENRNVSSIRECILMRSIER